MIKELIINPYTQIQLIHDSELVITSPKPGESLMTLNVAATENRELFDTFSEFAQVSLNFLDVENDISARDRELLLSHGVLVENGKAPEMPLFACLLEEVAPYEFEFDLNSLIVNPTFRFEPFDLANFAFLVNEQHLSPHQPKAWIVSPVSEIEIGYWLSPIESEVVSRFLPGQKPELPKDETFLHRLIGSEILVFPESQNASLAKWKTTIEQAGEMFERDNYAIVQKLLPDAHMLAMRRFYRDYVERGFMPFGDQQVKRRFRQHNEPLASFLHKKLAKLTSLVVGKELIPSYVYAASYKEGAELVPHTDREQCEYSISFQVDYQPEPEKHISPWALYVEPYVPDEGLKSSGASFGWSSEFLEENPSKTAVHLASGDGLFYKGRELIHYRFPLPVGHKSTSLFFHYVAADFTGNLS